MNKKAGLPVFFIALDGFGTILLPDFLNKLTRSAGVAKAAYWHWPG